MDIPFTKMHGLGNDFMVIDNRAGSYELQADTIRRWANRYTGIGFDQLLMVQEASVDGAQFDYRIFNADGGEVEHCGNGARCFARFVYDRGFTQDTTIPVNTSGGLITLRLLDDGDVTVDMGVPEFAPMNIPLQSESEHAQYELLFKNNAPIAAAGGVVQPVDERARAYFGSVSLGNPHAVLWVDDINTAPVAEIGTALQSHSVFPAGVNVGFMQRLSDSEIKLRVFERGVGETQACGTGACAAVAVGVRQGLLQRQVSVTLLGGTLKLLWPENNKTIEMTGPCSTVFEGQTRM